MTRRLLAGLAGLILCAGTAACGTTTITGQVNGTSGPGNPVEAVELVLTRGDLGSVENPRLVAFAGRNASEVLGTPAARLRMDVRGNPNSLSETYHFLQILTDEGAFSGGTSDQRSFVENHVGRLVHLRLRPGDISREVVRNGRAHVGAGWLGIVQDDDRVVPWQIDAGAANCLDVGGGDCFDLATLTGQLFSRVATAVERTVRDDVPLTTAVLHHLHFVPRVVHAGLEAGGRRARGFGLVYVVRLQAPLVTFDVFVPISVLFLDNIQGYRVAVDPVGFGSQAPGPENLARIYVRGSTIAALAEGTVRDAIRNALASTELPELIPGVAFEEVLLLGFNTAAGNPPVSGQPPRIFPRYEAVLLPEDDAQLLNSTALWETTNGSDLTERGRVRLVFIE